MGHSVAQCQLPKSVESDTVGAITKELFFNEITWLHLDTGLQRVTVGNVTKPRKQGFLDTAAY